VGPAEVIRHDLRGAVATRAETVHVARADLTLRPVPLVVAVDAVGRVGEPDRAVGPLDHVVRAVEPLALVAVGEHGEAPVVLGPGHPPLALLAADQAALP